MSIAKIAISIEKKQLNKIDSYIKKHVFNSRSQAFQIAIGQVLAQLQHERLARECAKLNINEEQEIADLG